MPAMPGSRRKRQRYYPRAMWEAPALDERLPTAPPSARAALLVNPFYAKDPMGSFGKHVLTPSHALLSIAGATPPEWSVRYWDENLLQGPPPCEPFPSVVGITVHLTFARRAYELARWYRRRGAKVVMGGLHASSCPGEVAAHADALVIGEGTSAWPELLRDAERGRLRPRYVGDYRRPYRESVAVRRDIIPQRDFLTTASLIATRGCRNRCGFCYQSTDGLRMPYQTRDVEDVAREFEATGEPYGVFIDNNLGSDREYLRALCDTLRPLGKIWSAAVTIDVSDAPSLVEAMARAGCIGVFVGLESLTGENLVDARKNTPRPEEYGRRVGLFRQYGIKVNGSFVFGFDHDRPDVFERTVEWIEENKLECATFHILTPYPGTPLFRQMEAEGRLLHRDWDLYDTGHAVFRPRHMTPEQLENGYDECYRRLFSLRSIWRRRPARAGDFLSHFVGTALYKKMNWLWPFLIRHRLTHAVWAPFTKLALRRHAKDEARTCHSELERERWAKSRCPARGGMV